MRIPAIVEIEWIDSASVNGWMRPEDWKEWTSGTIYLRTTGYLISAEGECYSVATCWAPDNENASGFFQIPKVAVKSLQVIKKGREK